MLKFKWLSRAEYKIKGNEAAKEFNSLQIGYLQVLSKVYMYWGIYQHCLFWVTVPDAGFAFLLVKKIFCYQVMQVLSTKWAVLSAPKEK